MRASLAALIPLLALPPAANAAPPSVDVLFPAGGQIGTSFEVTAGGKFDPWPAQIWTSDLDGLQFEPVAEKKGVFFVTVDANATPGPRLVRFFNAEGCSAPRQFVVGKLPEINEAEPNNALADSQPIDAASLPLTINGKLDPGGDVDGFAVDLPAGGTLVADATCYALDSPLDPLLHIRDERGTRLAFNHDAPGLGLDPRLAFTAPAAGRYTVRLFGFTHPPASSHRIGGSSKVAYRLTLNKLSPTPPPAGDELAEGAIPFQVAGVIASPDEADAFSFDAKKAEPLTLRVRAAALGSPLDPVLTVLDADGKTLATADDIDPKTNPDAKLDWSPPADGRYTVQVTDRFNNRSAWHHYRLEVEPQRPHFEATTATHALTLKAGETTEFPITVTRRYGHKDKLSATALDLPEGVTCEPVDVPDKGETKLVLKATDDAPAAKLPIRASVGDQPVSITLKGATTDAGDLLINQTDSVWLTVIR